MYCIDNKTKYWTLTHNIICQSVSI